MRKYLIFIGIFMLTGFFMVGCGTTSNSTAVAKKAIELTTPRRSLNKDNFEVGVYIGEISYKYLKEDIPVRVRVTNRLGEYWAGARSDIGANIFGGAKKYNVKYSIDTSLEDVAKTFFEKCFTVVKEEEGKNAPVIEFIVTGFNGDTFLDGRPANDTDWIIYTKMDLTLKMRLLDANENMLAEITSPQAITNQLSFTKVKYSNWTLEGSLVGEMVRNALNDLIPKFLADSRVRKGLMSSGATAPEVKELIVKAEEAEAKGDLKTAFDIYMQIISQGPLDYAIITRIIAITKGLNPAPEISEEALKRAAYAKAALDMAKDESGYFNAVQEYQKAIRLAPWWTDLYINNALVMEKAGLYADAAKLLKLYLLAEPKAADIDKIKMKMYELEYKAKQKEEGEKEKEKKGPVTIYI